MIIYNFFFFIPIIFWILNRRNNKLENIYFTLIFLCYLFILGFRDNIGNDWHAYYNHFFKKTYVEYNFFNFLSNPFFDLISNSNLYFGSFAAYNFIVSLIFLIGIFTFSYFQQDKIFAVTLCYPYLILFVGMGYIRQSVSISFFLIALILIFKRRNFFGFLFLFLSILCHKMILVSCMLLLLSFRSYHYKLVLIYLFFVIFFLLVFYFTGYMEHQIKFYLTQANYFTSNGVILRIILAIFPLIFLAFKSNNSFIFYKFEDSFFKKSSYFVIILMPLSLFFSTAVDRLLIFTSLSYVYIYAFSNISFYKSPILKNFLQPFILTVLFVYMNMWLLFSEYLFFWLPYENLLLKIF